MPAVVGIPQVGSFLLSTFAASKTRILVVSVAISISDCFCVLSLFSSWLLQAVNSKPAQINVISIVFRIVFILNERSQNYNGFTKIGQ
jgi:hypothetical protein